MVSVNGPSPFNIQLIKALIHDTITIIQTMLTIQIDVANMREILQKTCAFKRFRR